MTGGGEIRLRRRAIVKVSGKWDEDGVEGGEVSRDGDEMVKMIVINYENDDSDRMMKMTVKT